MDPNWYTGQWPMMFPPWPMPQWTMPQTPSASPQVPAQTNTQPQVLDPWAQYLVQTAQLQQLGTQPAHHASPNLTGTGEALA